MTLLLKIIYISVSIIVYFIDKGDVYVWGYGILGLGPQVQKISKPTMIPGTLFGHNVYNPNIKVIGNR